MKEDQVIRILLVEDDEDDYVLIRDVLAEIKGQQFELDWVSTTQKAMEKAIENRHDVCLMDYRLDERDGIQLTRDFLQCGCRAPIILLTGLGSHDVDMKAMKGGAFDYLEKASMSPQLLERSIRYAIEHGKTLAALKDSEQHLRILSAKLLDTQENERKIIAQELHDSIGSSLTAIRYGLEEKLLRMGKHNTPPEGISLERIISIVRDTIEEAHRISSNLRPSSLDDMGLISAIRSLCLELQEVYEGVEIEQDMTVQETEIHRSLKIVIYRVFQEALNNVFKHSKADSIHVSLKKTERSLMLSIRDNGEGFDPEAMLSYEGRTCGMGILGMRERTELSNGTFEITSQKGKGTVIEARWPLRQ
jgi:signal transduction histidine kinase